jgi:AcrR family transcriptional regulator
MGSQPKKAVAERPDGTARSTRRRARNAKFGERRNEIVDLSAQLFAANGYSATGIREIGEAADLARGALYYYIDSKESLLGEIHDRVLDPLLERSRSIAALDLSASQRLRMVSEILIRQVIERADHVWVFLHEYRSLTGDRRKTFRTKRAEFEGILLDLLAAGVDSGEFEIADLRYTMLAFLGMHNYTYVWVRRGEALDPLEVSKLYCDVFLRGVARKPAQVAET